MAWPLGARAQERVRRIGVLMSLAEVDPETKRRIGAFLERLRQLGWADGGNAQINYRWGGGNPNDIRRYAAELAALAPDVILATGSVTVGPLLEVTRTVPIVFVQVPIPSPRNSSIAWHGRAATPPVSSTLNTAWARNGWNC